MIFLFWLFSILSLVGMLGNVASTARVWATFGRKQPRDAFATAGAGLSMLVPLKGADANTETHLNALVESDVPVPVEYLLVMETAADPAQAICRRVQAGHPDKEIRIVFSGPPGKRMGKQHNLVEGLEKARYEIIGSMDADVHPEPDLLANGLRTLAQPGTGVAFSLPYYYGEGPPGGTLVALYTNYFFSLYIRALVADGSAPLTIGSLWFTTQDALARVGGLEQFTRTVTDDAAIGRAMARHGLRNVPIRQAVKISLEPLDLRGGIRHLQKWVTLLRAEGVSNFLLIFFGWHFLLWALLALLAGRREQGVPPRAGLGLLLAALLVRSGSTLSLNRSVYRALPRTRFLPFLPIYEILLVPGLFLTGFFRRSVEWRGRRYRVGPEGIMIVGDNGAP